MLPVTRTPASLNPFLGTPFSRLDALFDRFLGDEGEAAITQGRGWSHLPMAMWADEEFLYVEVEAPGVEEKDVEITVHGEVLTVKAQRTEPEGRKYLFNGRLFGRFERTVILPEAVDSERVEATLSNGVLRLTLPRKAETRPRKITLKGS